MLLPCTPEELAAVVCGANRLHVPLLGPPPNDGAPAVGFAALAGGIRHDAADGVVSCLSGTRLATLNAVLAQDGRCVPYAKVWPAEVDDLASLILLGLPHAGEAEHGGWRDWLLGATMVKAEGGIVRSGSRVVKSVAGYDAHKLLVGSRGALVLPAEIALRTYPLSALGFPQGVHSLGDKVRAILRVEPTNLTDCLSEIGEEALYVDRGTATVWTSRSVQDLPRFPSAWSVDPFAPSLPEASLALQRRAKAILDPRGKLAPRAFQNL